MYRHVKEAGSALLFPAFCINCKSLLQNDLKVVCHPCAEQLQLIDPQMRCAVCFAQLESKHIQKCLECRKKAKMAPRAFCFEYFGAIQSLFATISQKPHLIRALSSYLLVQHDQLGWPMPDIITFVPETFLVSKLKGASPSFLLAKELSKMMQIPTTSLVKKRYVGLIQTSFTGNSHSGTAVNKIILLIGSNLDQDSQKTLEILQRISPNRAFLLTLCN